MMLPLLVGAPLAAFAVVTLVDPSVRGLVKALGAALVVAAVLWASRSLRLTGPQVGGVLPTGALVVLATLAVSPRDALAAGLAAASCGIATTRSERGWSAGSALLVAAIASLLNVASGTVALGFLAFQHARRAPVVAAVFGVAIATPPWTEDTVVEVSLLALALFAGIGSRSQVVSRPMRAGVQRVLLTLALLLPAVALIAAVAALPRLLARGSPPTAIYAAGAFLGAIFGIALVGSVLGFATLNRMRPLLLVTPPHLLLCAFLLDRSALLIGLLPLGVALALGFGSLGRLWSRRAAPDSTDG